MSSSDECPSRDALGGFDPSPTYKMDLGRCLILTHPARLGDSVMALPLHRAIAARTTLASNVGPDFRFLFEMAGIDVAYSGKLYPKGARALFTEARGLRSQGFGSVFLVRPNFRSALLAFLARIPVRVGDATEGRGFLLTHQARVPPKANQLVRLNAFGAAVGVQVPTEFGLPTAPKRQPPTIGIAPGASYADKLIPPAALREVGGRLLAAGYQLVLLGGPSDRQWVPPFEGLDAEDWVAKFSLPDLVGPLSTLRAVVASDGGLYHLAVGCGVPSVGVYGPTAGRHWWHAWGHHTPVLAPGGQMERVTADSIWEAVERTLKGSAVVVSP